MKSTSERSSHSLRAKSKQRHSTQRIRWCFHQERERSLPIATDFDTTTSEQAIEVELLVCLRHDPDGSENDVIIGEWDPRSGNLRRPLRFPPGAFLRVFSL